MANGIPTGSAPLFLGDFASPLTGVTQKLIGDMAQQYAYKQDKKDKDMAYMLKALDFTTLENATDEMQQKLLNRANEIEDKWSGIYLANDMSLSDQQKLELKRDMREYDRMRANIQGNIQKIGHAQSELADPKAFNVYDKSSWQALTDYVQKGDYTKDASQILRPVIDVYGIVDELTTDWKNTNFIETDKSNDYDTGIRTITKSNIPILEQKAQQLVNDPNLQPLLQDPQYRDRVIGAINSKFNAYKFEKKEPEPISQSDIAGYKKNQAVKDLPTDLKPLADKTGLTDPAKLKYVKSQNEMTQKILQGDQTSLDLVKGEAIPGWGTVADYNVDKDGTITFYSSNPKQEPYVLPVPDWNDPESVSRAKVKIKEFLPSSMLGKESFTGSSNYMFGEVEPLTITKAQPTALKNITEMLNVPGKEKGDEISYYDKAGNRVDGSFVDKGYRESVVSQVKELLPEANIKAVGVMGIRNKRPVEWDGTEYDLATEKGRKDLETRVRSEFGSEQPVLETTPSSVSYDVNGTRYNIPSDQVDEFLKDFPSAKKL